jgi:uncharacterized membrane protein YphA (DoxX/SURF4 family)
MPVQLAAAAPLTHETWFVHHPEDYPLDWSALASPSVIAGLVAVCVLAVAWRVVAGRFPAPELRPLAFLARLVPWVPRLLALHLGVSLLLLASTRSILAPDVTVPGGAAHTLLLAPEVLAALLLVTGYGVPLAGYVVVVAGPIVWALAGPQALLSCLVLLGIALFLIVLPPRMELGGRARMDVPHLRPALLMLRIGTAGTLLTLAVVEKLANPAMAQAMLVQKPVLNVLAPLGVSAAGFATVAGCVEVLFALLVLSGAAPQVVALVAAVPFTSTLFLFGGTELIGHLPVYGVLLAMLVLGSEAQTSREVSWLRRPARASRARRDVPTRDSVGAR